MPEAQIPSPGLGRPSYLRPPGRPLSDFDRELLALLQIDGRRAFAQLARDLQSTEKRVRRRMAELDESGVMKITAVTEPRALGYEAGALMGITVDGTRDVRSIVADLTEVHPVDYVVAATGRFPIYAEAFCRNLDELLTISGEIVPAIPGVNTVEVFPYLSVHYQQAQFASARARGAPATGVRPVALDDTDLAILRELTSDGRVAAQHVAQRLDVSESQVRNRIKRMTTDGTLQVIAILNPLGREYQAMAWVAIRAAPSQPVRELADRVARLPFVTFLTICAGRFDMFAEIVCENPAELLRVLDEHVRPLPGIADLESALYLDLRYRPLLPA
jgi:Lrp/AsnC family transcriptional regulator for asnA, asnC and gidA